FVDSVGNSRRKHVAMAGRLVQSVDELLAVIAAAGWRPGPQQPLPEEARMFLQPSRHCEGRPLARHAQLRFADLPSDRVRVRAICAHVARTIEYAPESVDFTRGALRALQEGRGICRDFTHAAIGLCRNVGIPARYCAGYPAATAGMRPEP